MSHSASILAQRAARRRLPFNVVAFALVVLSIALPFSLFAWMAWKEHANALDDGKATAQRTARVLHEHALAALQTGELLLRHLARQIGDRSWRDIEADIFLQRQLAELAEAAPGGAAIVLADKSGRVRASSAMASSGLSLAGRDYFRELKETGVPLAIGAPTTGSVSGEPIFPLAIRRVDEHGHFDGVLTIGLSLSHFTDFWRQFAPSIAHVIPLMRGDGLLLARYPALNNPQRLDPEGPFMRALRVAPRGVYTAVSQVDGIERLNAYTRIGKYPLYVSFSIETRAMLAEWRAGLLSRALFTALAMAALLSLSAMLIRHTRSMAGALRNAREATRRVEAEMARREAAEENLRQAMKMETIGQITGGLAHDFNNLLQLLSNNLHLATRTAQEPARAVSFIGAALEAVKKGATLTRQLLAFSRRQPLAPKPVCTQALLFEMLGLLRTTAGASVEVKVQPGVQLWPAMVDRNQAEMAILNLVVNARDAMPKGGTITLSSANLCLRGHDPSMPELAPGEYVVIAVRDTGTGMSAEVARRAFEPFFTTKELGKGSGLGLSQVHGFAAQSGGAARIDTFPGAGTTVRLYLPRACETPRSELPPSAAVPGAAANDGPRLTILLVDDDGPVRKGVAATLLTLGHSVVEASSGEEALDTLALRREIGVLVTDYTMPGMRGTQLARLARRMRPKLAIVLITGSADLPDADAAEWNVLRKPFAPEQLVARLAEQAQPRVPVKSA